MIAETLNLAGDRLRLRPFKLDDAPRVQQLADNWKVASMVARMPYPYPPGAAEEWISGHAERRSSGNDWPFAIEIGGELVGAVGVSRDESGPMELGYWIGEPYWGQGIATEAARILVEFAFDILGEQRLTAGYFKENPSSGRVLTKLGFRAVGEETRFCLARGEEVDCIELELTAKEARR